MFSEDALKRINQIFNEMGSEADGAFNKSSGATFVMMALIEAGLNGKTIDNVEELVKHSIANRSFNRFIDAVISGKRYEFKNVAPGNEKQTLLKALSLNTTKSDGTAEPPGQLLRDLSNFAESKGQIDVIWAFPKTAGRTKEAIVEDFKTLLDNPKVRANLKEIWDVSSEKAEMNINILKDKANDLFEVESFTTISKQLEPQL